MRLIDADELIKYFDEDLEGYDNREYILQMLDAKGRIERVEAIPIEWIKEWTKKQWKECMPIDTIRLVIDWKEENEID